MRNPEALLSATAVLLFALAAPAAAQTVSRGPYLQQGSNSQVIVRWRTSTATDSRVRYGLSTTGPWTNVDDSASVTDHIVKITGLTADTKYFYSVGSTSAVLSGPDANTFFVTAPTPGVAKKTRVWVLGDSGTNNSSQQAVRNAYYSFTGSTHTDLWLMLGDNAYTSGTDAEFQNAVFGATNAYPAMLRKSVLWPTIGNHDGGSANSLTQTGPYYDIFSLPTAGEAGGLASGTEAYYSFDYGNIHFICLESYQVPANATAFSTMKTWVTNDINATARDWIIVFWHHPPYSKGSHDSDTDSLMTKMRTDINPIIENGGVDLVLTGHSHAYERSFLIDGHYGLSTTFTSAMKLDGGSGRDPNPYQKAAGTPAHDGAVYVVAGSSGQTAGGSLNHPAMFVSLNNLGSMVLDINGSRLDARFLRETGASDDTFSIVKGSPPPPTPSITVTATDASAAEAGPNTGTFTVSRGTSGATALLVNLAVGGSATNGTDYTLIGNNVTIPAGSASTTVTVTPVDDALLEPAETVTLTVTAGAGYTVGTPATGTVTITDNDTPVVTVAATDANAAEAGANPGTFTVSRTGSTASTLQVGFTIGGTATGGSDYTLSAASPITIPAGSASATVTVTPIDDALTESGETVVLTLTAGAGYLIGASTNATVTITDNDASADADGDGLPDAWEIQHFGNTTSQNGSGDPDGDGATNAQEFAAGTDPMDPNSKPASGGSSGGGGGGGGGCGLTGLEALGLLAALRGVRRIRIRGPFPSAA
jgi:hypothetical protein